MYMRLLTSITEAQTDGGIQHDQNIWLSHTAYLHIRCRVTTSFLFPGRFLHLLASWDRTTPLLLSPKPPLFLLRDAPAYGSYVLSRQFMSYFSIVYDIGGCWCNMTITRSAPDSFIWRAYRSYQPNYRVLPTWPGIYLPP